MLILVLRKILTFPIDKLFLTHFILKGINWWDEELVDSRQMIDELPQLMILFAFLFYLPRWYWDSKVGGTLTSYLNYLLLLIEILKAKLETVPEEGHFGGDEEGMV